ncbi:OLC1v1002836C1 [Oldenlandia corymbosa var. corymbosa]|uniref:OLC1v1002836C1 n=1 Tax=Oldenlandia corymbosa var. corymbosa TaxID=529605 RepID=A0AAV1DBJ4_OLDCO|nr:OLC1v1002836C1 [Oldenlandia corymbosa var. corymbosa]
MDPCPFVRIVVSNLALRQDSSSPSTKYSVNSAKFPSCYCKIKLDGFPSQFSTIPWILQESDAIDSKIHAGFSFKKSDFERLVGKSAAKKSGNCSLKIEIFSGNNKTSCGLKSEKLMGTASVKLDLKAVENSIIGSNNKGCVVIHSGWISMLTGSLKGSHLHANVKAEPDPRFVFQFDGEPECSPQVFQVNGNVKQPVFSCKFGFRNSGGERNNLRTRSSISEKNAKVGCFSSSIGGDKEQPIKERKGWSITIHDLSGSPVAAASMVTPFVPSPGSDKVSKSNPGAWLILRPGQGTWKPWGRLEAWREQNHSDNIGYRFELIPDGSIDTITLANSSIPTRKGGKFSIDVATGVTPMTSPNSSFDFSSLSSCGSGSELGSGSWAHLLYRGFVMSSTLNGDGKCSKPEVEIGVHHVSCTEDAAAYVALAAALDLSIDACRSFSQKLRKELRQSDLE